MKTTLTIVLLLLPFLCKVENINRKYNKQFVYPSGNFKESFIKTLIINGDSICKNRNISTELMISMAIVEQGYKINKNYRIFNLVGSKNTERVFDKGVNEYRNYRIYKDLQSSIRDYANLLANDKRYNLLKNKSLIEQIELLNKVPYAEDKLYSTKVKKIYCTIVEPYFQKIKIIYN